MTENSARPAGAFFIWIFSSMRITNRFQAFGAHLSGSLAVALFSAALVFLVWYPDPLPAATGVTAIFLMLLGIDVIVGPFITLVVYNPRKKELRRDLLVVLALQLAALIYGLHTVYIARPVYYVFSADRFELVFANDLTDDKLAKVNDERFRHPPNFGPAMVAAKRPTDAKTRNEIMFSALSGGDDVAQRPEFYVPLRDMKDDIVARLQPLETLRQFNKDDVPRVDAVIARYRNHAGGVGFLPVRGKVQDTAAIVGKDAGEVLEIVTLKPWN